MIYDISQPVFECQVYPGTTHPERKVVYNMSEGSLYNLTDFSMCCHNGTHVDAPYHFIQDGKTIEQIELNKFAGLCYVVECEGELVQEEAIHILEKAKKANIEAAKKILIKGNAIVTKEAANVFANANIDLIGTELQTVGPEKAPMAVHLILLKKDVVLLEGIRLGQVQEGVYLLNCIPLNLSGCDGAPCRAVLFDL